MARVRPCEAIVPLAAGGGYVCGRHTRNKDARCQAHRPPPATKRPPQPIMPRQLRQDIPGDRDVAATPPH